MCGVSEIDLSEHPPTPSNLVRLHEGVVITADETAGLRAWSVKRERRLTATSAFIGKQSDGPRIPTSLAIDCGPATEGADDVEVVVGFRDGTYSIYRLDMVEGTFNHRYTQVRSTTSEMISAMAFSSPYLLTMTAAQRLCLYQFGPDDMRGETMEAPRRLLCFQSGTVWPPLSLSLRRTRPNIIATVTYALPTYLVGWSVGLQELHITAEGQLIDSRLASAVNQGFRPLSPSSSSPPTPRLDESTLSAGSSEDRSGRSSTKPTSLSYNHPYLLASHADNTLTLHLVTSSERELSINGGSRLWGHTSSVTGVHVGSRGKAVSVSSRGDELRIWQLEGGLMSVASRRRLAAGQMSVPVRMVAAHPSSSGRPVDDPRLFPELGLSSSYDARDTTGREEMMNGWVDFDDETVVLLREKRAGRHALVVCDFT
jgi:hypothetical protein